MITPTEIRSALTEDAPRLSALIQTTIRVSNAQDYPVAVIDCVVENFSVSTVQTFINQRQVLVAIDAENIVGTASLDSEVVRSVLCMPHGRVGA